MCYSTCSWKAVDSRVGPSNFLGSVPLCHVHWILHWFYKAIQPLPGLCRRQLVLGPFWDLFLYVMPFEFYIGIIIYSTCSWGAVDSSWSLKLSGICFLWHSPAVLSWFGKVFNIFLGSCRQQLVLSTFLDFFLFNIFVEFHNDFINLFNLFLGGCRQQLVLGTFWDLFLYNISSEFYNGFITLFNIFLEGCRRQLVLGTF